MRINPEPQTFPIKVLSRKKKQEKEEKEANALVEEAIAELSAAALNEVESAEVAETFNSTNNYD